MLLEDRVKAMSQRDSKNITINVDTDTVLRFLAMLVGTFLLLSFIEKIMQPLTLILVAFFLALALNPAVSWIANKLKSKSRVRATGVAYLFVLAFLGIFFTTVIPPLFKQTADFIKDVPSIIDDFQTDDSTLSQLLRRYDADEQLDQLSSEFGSRFGDVSRPVLETAGAIGTTVVSVIVVLVLTFMMLVEGPTWLKKLWDAQPKNKREFRKRIAYRMYRVVTSYVNGQVFIAALGGAFAAVALFIFSNIFDAPINPIALGAIVALFALLPLIGTILGSIIVVLASLLVSVPLAIAMAIYFVIYQQIENVTIQPYVQSRNNNLTPLIVFVAALIGVGFGGILGALLAIPVAGSIKVLIEEYYNLHKGKNSTARTS